MMPWPSLHMALADGETLNTNSFTWYSMTTALDLNWSSVVHRYLYNAGKAGDINSTHPLVVTSEI